MYSVYTHLLHQKYAEIICIQVNTQEEMKRNVAKENEVGSFQRCCLYPIQLAWGEDHALIKPQGDIN